MFKRIAEKMVSEGKLKINLLENGVVVDTVKLEWADYYLARAATCPATDKACIIIYGPLRL